MGKYRKNLSGSLTFRSFIPTPVSQIHPNLTFHLQRLSTEVEKAMCELNEAASRLTDEESQKFMRQEAEYSCKLAWGEPTLSFDFMPDADNGLKEDTANLLRATNYAFDALDGELPLCARLLKNAHYLICKSEKYEKKYPGEFRISPVWIGWKTESLNNALFVPPVNEDMTDAFTDLERYMNYEETENVFIRTALVHYQFEMIHPFIDGNGRTGRLLNSLFLKQQGILDKPILLLSRYLYSRAAIYYNEIQETNETGTYENWLHFYLTALKTAAQHTLQDIRRLGQ